MSLERNESEAEARYLPVSHGVRIRNNFSILPLRDVILDGQCFTNHKTSLSLLCAWLSSFSNKCKWARGHQRNQEMFSLVVILDEGLSPGLLSVFVSLSSSSVLSLCFVDLAILSSPFMIVSSCSVTVFGGLELSLN